MVSVQTATISSGGRPTWPSRQEMHSSSRARTASRQKASTHSRISSVELPLQLSSTQTANGSTSPKVFKWTTVDLGADETTRITKRRRIQTASTRRYHAGEHRVELQVAGRVVADAAFDLLDSSA